MQKTFTHLTNHLTTLGKTLTNNDLNLQILISLTRAWQAKQTSILEKKKSLYIKYVIGDTIW